MQDSFSINNNMLVHYNNALHKVLIKHLTVSIHEKPMGLIINGIFCRLVLSLTSFHYQINYWDITGIKRNTIQCGYFKCGTHTSVIRLQHICMQTARMKLENRTKR